MADGKRRLMVTGGAGFIGSAVCRHFVASGRYHIVNVDKLTHAGNLQSLRAVAEDGSYSFYHADICDRAAIGKILRRERVEAIMHLAAESHVDRSIASPAAVLETNIIGTFQLLEAARDHWGTLPAAQQESFRFHHVSTDEVFGELPPSGMFTEASAYAPSSPYSASKASADHLVRAWMRTYDLPIVISNSTNNYGPFQHPEKLIPLMVLNALQEMPLPVYGAGTNVRDWLFVEDHVQALELVLTQGSIGESYLVGARAERDNLTVVERICAGLDARRPRRNGRSYRALIEFVADRPGHDFRYAVDPTKIERSLGWRPNESFERGLGRTLDWYLDNEWWWRPLRSARRDL
jgi:dTDP-glucose 4,6-dehydratase